MPIDFGRTLTLPARMSRLADAIAFVDAFCRDAGIARDDGLRLSLVVEELFTNTVQHGHGADCDAPIRLALHDDAEALVLDYADSAPPFDPRSGGASLAGTLRADAGEGPASGFGLALIAGLVDGISHASDGDGNQLRLVLRRRG